MNLAESLSEIGDFRRAEGKRYPLLPMLLIIIMSIICGRVRYREIADFAKANKSELRKAFRLKCENMPSHVTFREIIRRSNFEEISQAFEKWAKNYVRVEKGDWFSADGKSIRSTVSDYNKSYQDFISLISVFAQRHGQIIGIAELSNKKSSEIPAVEELIRTLNLREVVFTTDALHCQKNSEDRYRNRQ